MKGYKVPVVIVLAGLVIAGWLILAVYTTNANNSRYTEIMADANDTYDRGLYELAAKKYDEALELKNTKETTDKQLSAWAALYAQDESSYPEYISSLLKAIKTYPREASYILTAADLYVKDEKFDDAYEILKNAISIGVKDDSVSKKYREVKYSFTVEERDYTSFVFCADSGYLVSDGLVWKMINSDGYGESNISYSGLSRPNPDGMMMYVDESGARLIDKDGVVQGIFGKATEAAGICAEDRIAVCSKGIYSYYSIRGDKLFGEYKNAGTFDNSLAAVNVNGKWGIVDADGKMVVDPTYEDIKLDSEGKYISQSVILAKKDGKYQLYDDKWKTVGDFACDQADLITPDGVFAFSSGGKWGFADTRGNVVIEPQYENARSFSNGLAAVCKDGLWGFIDTKGNLVIACQFLDADYFNDKGLCMVRKSAETWQILKLNVQED